MLAKDVKPKMYVHLDFGYGRHENWHYAKVERVIDSISVFGEPRISITSRYADTIITSDFEPDEEVTTK